MESVLGEGESVYWVRASQCVAGQVSMLGAGQVSVLGVVRVSVLGAGRIRGCRDCSEKK